MVGIALGVLMGVLSGAIFVFLLRDMVIFGNTLVHALKVVGEVISIPGFWFGGPWVTTGVLKDIEWALIIENYLIALSLVFLGISATTLLRFISRITNELQLGPP
jgi:hypothetical protein